MPALYPLSRTTTPQADPGLAHTLPISDVNDLQAMQNNLSGNYYLTGNIDASITSTWDGGAGFVPITTFTGTLDGCGYTISNLWIHRYSWVGLFNTIHAGAKVANLLLSNINYYGDMKIGALCSSVYIDTNDDILIQNVHATGVIGGNPVSKGLQSCGGLLGSCAYSTGTGTIYVYDSSAGVTIDQTYSNDQKRGGFVGAAEKCVVFYNCHATGDFINPADEFRSYMGGFAGWIEHVSCTYCYATGNVDGGQKYSAVGGFSGHVHDSIISRCYATGNVQGDHYIAGFIGIFSGVLGDFINDCYATGNATAYMGTASGVGGFVGQTNGCNYENCYSIGSAVGIDAGGLIGGCAGGDVYNSYWDKESSGNMTSAKGEGHNTIWFKTQTHFIGWDFLLVWYMPSYGKQAIMGRPRGSYPVGCKHTALRNVYI